MPTPVTAPVTYTTPKTFLATEALTATEWNAVAKDISFFRARPYLLVWQTTAPTTATLGNSTNALSTSLIKNLFSTNNGGAIGQTSSTSVGTISINGDGRVSTPTSLTGLYRVNCQMMVGSVSGAHARVSAQLFDSAGNLIGAIPGTWAYCGTTFNAVSVVSFVIPFNVSSSFGTVNGVKFVGQYASTAVAVVTQDDNGNGPAQKQFNTFAQIEYLGTNTGSF